VGERDEEVVGEEMEEKEEKGGMKMANANGESCPWP